MVCFFTELSLEVGFQTAARLNCCPRRDSSLESRRIGKARRRSRPSKRQYMPVTLTIELCPHFLGGNAPVWCLGSPDFSPGK